MRGAPDRALYRRQSSHAFAGTRTVIRAPSTFRIFAEREAITAATAAGDQPAAVFPVGQQAVIDVERPLAALPRLQRDLAKADQSLKLFAVALDQIELRHIRPGACSGIADREAQQDRCSSLG